MSDGKPIVFDNGVTSFIKGKSFVCAVFYNPGLNVKQPITIGGKEDATTDTDLVRAINLPFHTFSQNTYVAVSPVPLKPVPTGSREWGFEPSQLAKTDPSQTTKELSMTYGENVTAHVAYRCPAINKDQEAKVSYKLLIERPDKAGDSENQKGITAGAGKNFARAA